MVFDLNADELELYTTAPELRAGCRRASVSINKALNKIPAIVGNLIASGVQVETAIYQTLKRVVRPVLVRNRKYGASDTEPEVVISMAVSTHFGFGEYFLDRFEW